MNRSRAIELLAPSKPDPVARHGVTEIALFGSTGRRDAAQSDTEVEILVAFDGPATSKRCFGVQFHLEDLFSRSIELVTKKALRPEPRPFVEKEAVHV